MVQSFLGETTFTGALKKYLNDQAFSTGTHDILFQHWIDEASANGQTFPYPLQNVFECWSLQMGYPLITVTRIDANTIRLTQEYFLIDPNDSPVDTPGSLTYKYQWYVPFTYRGVSEFGSATITTEWMGLTPTTTFTSTEDYILGNIKGNGFYRINYDLDMWGKLSLKLKDSLFKEIPVENRAQLVDDIFALSRSGRIDISLALDLATYMVNEDEYIPWQTFLDAMTYCEYMLGASPIYGDFSKYILDLVVPSIYADLGWDDSNTSDSALITRMIRGEAIDAACTYGNQNCIDNAVMLFDQWRNDTTTIISSTYRTDVFCTAIREGGLAEWDFAWEQYLISQNAQFQSSLRYGLSCSKDAWVLNRYLEYAMDPTKVRKQDIQNTFSYIARQEYGKYTAWAFAMNNWDRVINQAGSSAMSSLLSGAVRRFSTIFDMQLIESLKPVAGPAWTNTLNSHQVKVQANIDWRSNNEASIAQYLNSSIVIPTSPYNTHKSRQPDLPVLVIESSPLHKHNRRYM